MKPLSPSSANYFPHDVPVPLLSIISQEFVDFSNAVLQSTRFQMHIFPAMTSAISSHLVAAHLQAESAVSDKGNILTNAQPHQAAIFSAPKASVKLNLPIISVRLTRRD